MARFDDVKATFWAEGTDGAQPPLTDAMVSNAEHVLGVRLPASLLVLLRVQNGGEVATEWNAFPTRPTSWSEDHVPFRELMGIGRSSWEPNGHALSLLDTPYLVQEWGLPSPVVLLSGDGHTWIALDYRISSRQGEPSVTWFDTELETESALAADFRSFVEDLTADDTFNNDVGTDSCDGR